MIDRLFYAAVGLALLSVFVFDNNFTSTVSNTLLALEPVRAWELAIGAIFFALLIATGVREMLFGPGPQPMSETRVIVVTAAAIAVVIGGIYNYWPREPALAAPVVVTEAVAVPVETVTEPVVDPAPATETIPLPQPRPLQRERHQQRHAGKP
jgi:hypothetical protein